MFSHALTPHIQFLTAKKKSDFGPRRVRYFSNSPRVAGTKERICNPIRCIDNLLSIFFERSYKHYPHMLVFNIVGKLIFGRPLRSRVYFSRTDRSVTSCSVWLWPTTAAFNLHYSSVVNGLCMILNSGERYNMIP